MHISPVSNANIARRTRSIDPFDSWVAKASQAAWKRARKAGRSEFDAADISQNVALYAAERGASIMEAYPDPELFAAVRTFHASVAWDRRDGSQSGKGVAFGRAKVSLNASCDDAPGVGDTLVSTDDVADLVERRLLDETVRLVVATELDARTASWLWDVKGDGMKVSDVARRDGVPREYVSRAVNAAVRQLQAVVGEFIGG